MPIRTYNDITSRDRKLVSLADADEVRATDLRREVEEYLGSGTNGPVVEHLIAGAFNQQSIEVVYFPDTGRAGVCHGGNAAWTDASSAEDALRRYFGVDGASMTP